MCPAWLPMRFRLHAGDGLEPPHIHVGRESHRAELLRAWDEYFAD